MDDHGRGIPVVGPDISYDDFLDTFLRPLKPCIITGLTKDWPAAYEWTTHNSATGKSIPNLSLLKDVFGASEGCVTMCEEIDTNGDATVRETHVSQFIDEFSRNLKNGTTRKTYLKDFHFVRVTRSPNAPYTVPKFFQGNLISNLAYNIRRLVQPLRHCKRQGRFPFPVPGRGSFIHAVAP